MEEFRINRRGGSPCRGCPDRYIACSDHCRKPAYLAWKEESCRIAQARRAYNRQKDDAVRHSEQRRRRD